MCKKVTLGVFALLLIGGLLFGTNAIPLAKTYLGKARKAAQDAIPISVQIETAENQLAEINPEIKDMVWQIAKEKAEIKRLAADVERQTEALTVSKDQMMTLREHLDSGEEYYVGTNGKAYKNSRVKEDLAHRLSVYKTAQLTIEKKQQVLDLRQQALEAAFAQLDEAQAKQRELEVQIANLKARNSMVEVAKTASNINIDNSELSKTQKMVDNINARIDTEEEMLNLVPKYLGQIPVGDEIVDTDADVVQEFDEYFSSIDDSSLTKN